MKLYKSKHSSVQAASSKQPIVLSFGKGQGISFHTMVSIYRPCTAQSILAISFCCIYNFRLVRACKHYRRVLNLYRWLPCMYCKWALNATDTASVIPITLVSSTALSQVCSNSLQTYTLKITYINAAAVLSPFHKSTSIKFQVHCVLSWIFTK